MRLVAALQPAPYSSYPDKIKFVVEGAQITSIAVLNRAGLGMCSRRD